MAFIEETERVNDDLICQELQISYLVKCSSLSLRSHLTNQRLPAVMQLLVLCQEPFLEGRIQPPPKIGLAQKP